MENRVTTWVLLGNREKMIVLDFVLCQYKFTVMPLKLCVIVLSLLFYSTVQRELPPKSVLTKATAKPSTAKPNIILIMVDDMGWSDIGCYGGEIPTPNIDRLAKGGLRFKRFYNTGRCCPTRASLLTGNTRTTAPFAKAITRWSRKSKTPLGNSST